MGTLDEVLAEVVDAQITERGASRADDKVNAAAMERGKRTDCF